MVLKPLEFSDCISDSPWFRQNLHEHERALDDAYKNMKNIEIQCRELINCTKKLSQAQRAFSKSLIEFKIETVGTNQTDDERVISTCLKEFGKHILSVEEERTKILHEAETHYLEPLKRFRTEAIGRTIHEEKRKYEKESAKFYQSLEKNLHLTIRKNDFKEADAQLDMHQHNFCKASLQYVAEIQSVQERMKFEFVETLSSFLYSWLTFYHVGHVMHEDFKPYLDGVQVRVQKTKESFNATIAEAEGLKDKMLKTYTRSGGSSGSVSKLEGPAPNIKQGYLYMQEKSKIPKTIGRDVLGKCTKYYCVFQKESRIFTMILNNSAVKTDMKNALGQTVAFKLKECIRRSSDSIDKRFCFDVVGDEKSEVMTFQALSEEDRRQWIDAMDGRQAVYSPGTGPSCSGIQTQLDENGFEFVSACLTALEERGLNEQGLYRNCGVNSKVHKLMQLALDKRSNEKLNVDDEIEWDTKTLSSAVKSFLRNLPEPLLTFDCHTLFINAAKMNDCKNRVDHIHYYVYCLPPEHKRMLELIIKHLKRVADKCEENLMTVGNLGVCFGPTLMRPKEESYAAIMDIKFFNVVVEVLISNCDQIFNNHPPNLADQPCPPKPDHRNVEQGRSQPVGSSLGGPENGRSLSGNSKISRSRAIGTASPAIRARDPKQAMLPINSHFHESLEGNSSTKLTLDCCEPTTSGGTTPTTPPHGLMLSRARDSSDSLNSFNSHGSADSAKVAIIKSTEVKGKKSTSYAPSYNPLACETVNRAHGAVPLVGTSTRLKNNEASPTYESQPFSAVQRSTTHYNPTSSLQPSRRVKTLYACTPDHESELCFQPGQIITNVYESKEPGWLIGTLNGKTGLIPENYVEALP